MRFIIEIKEYMGMKFISSSERTSIYIYIRGVSDVGFLIFADADTDADFAF